MKKRDLKIVIADDHVQTAVGISTFLDFNGIKNFQAYNAKQAIDLCKKEKPNLLIYESRMEELPGCEITKKLPNQKVLFVITPESESEVIKCTNSVGVIIKPIDNSELLEKIKSLFKITD